MNRLVNVALVIGALAVVGALAIVAGGFAFAGTDPRSQPDRMSARIAKALDAVDATPEQRAAVQAASLDIQAKLKASDTAAWNARGQVAELLAADQVDPDVLQHVLDSRADQLKVLTAAIIPDLVKMHDALTPGQRQALYEEWTARQEVREQLQQQ
ncbi:MAG TPA: periplasmic heavy metal sensor [Myxococcales bacterium]|nr:periplasmic heavy metal sensor [Myxococcales bacterium]